MVCHLLQLAGVPVYISDEETRKLMVSHPGIRSDLLSLLGPQVYQDGGLNKPLLASYLFSSPQHAARINAIVHPRVKDDFRQWVASQHAACRCVAIESAILIEAGFAGEVDHVVMVSAPLEVRIRRAMQRDGADRASIEQRVRSQMDDGEKSLLADWVIRNDGEIPLIPQVLQLIASLSGNND